MSQREILKHLEKNNNWQDINEIIKQIPELSSAGIQKNLYRLVKGGFIEVKPNPKKKHAYLYRIKD